MRKFAFFFILLILPIAFSYTLDIYSIRPGGKGSLYDDILIEEHEFVKSSDTNYSGVVGFIIFDTNAPTITKVSFEDGGAFPYRYPEFWAEGIDDSGVAYCYITIWKNGVLWKNKVFVNAEDNNKCTYKLTEPLNPGDYLIAQWRMVDYVGNESADVNTGVYTYSVTGIQGAAVGGRRSLAQRVQVELVSELIPSTGFNKYLARIMVRKDGRKTDVNEMTVEILDKKEQVISVVDLNEVEKIDKGEYLFVVDGEWIRKISYLRTSVEVEKLKASLTLESRLKKKEDIDITEVNGFFDKYGKLNVVVSVGNKSKKKVDISVGCLIYNESKLVGNCKEKKFEFMPGEEKEVLLSPNMELYNDTYDVVAFAYVPFSTGVVKLGVVEKEKETEIFGYVIFGAIIILLLALVGLLFYSRKKRKKVEKKAEGKE
ncbi:MAG: hypothetical protein ACTSV7_14825 [Candidatus Baldrarchaeia archaeon]